MVLSKDFTAWDECNKIQFTWETEIYMLEKLILRHEFSISLFKNFGSFNDAYIKLQYFIEHIHPTSFDRHLTRYNATIIILTKF